MAPPGVGNNGRQVSCSADPERDASALIAKIDQLVNHKAYPEPKSLSQLVYEKTHPPFEDFERTIQDAWDVGITGEPINRQQGGGCCGAPKPTAQKGGCGCGPKSGATGGCGSGGGGCGCGPAAPSDRQGGGGCCGSPKEEESPVSAKGRKRYEPNLVPADLANRVYKYEPLKFYSKRINQAKLIHFRVETQPGGIALSLHPSKLVSWTKVC